tara:strand:- start:6 stop:134 length:129 start_codon:yes stop_codon:yes gene_type:complete
VNSFEYFFGAPRVEIIVLKEILLEALPKLFIFDQVKWKCNGH